MTNLAELAIGQNAHVQKIDGADDISLRLLEMGLTPGTAVSVLGAAPLGDPIELAVRGYRLSIRKSEAARIMVTVV